MLVINVLRLIRCHMVIEGVARREVRDWDGMPEVIDLITATKAVERVRAIPRVVDSHRFLAHRIQRINNVSELSGKASGTQHLHLRGATESHVGDPALAEHIHVMGSYNRV